MSFLAATPWALMGTAIAWTFLATALALYPRVGLLEAALMAPPIGLSISAWLVMLVKSLPVVGPGIPYGVILTVTVLQGAVAYALYPRAKALLANHRRRLRDEYALNRPALIMLALMAVWWAYNNDIHYLKRRGNDHIAGGSVYADLPFHTNIVTSFLNGANENATIFSSLMSCFYAGVTLAYPFMPDFYISALVAGGFDLHAALTATGAILLTSLSGLIYAFNARLTGSRPAGMIAVWLVLLSGGLGGWYYIQSEPSWWTWAALTSQKFIHGPDHVLYWTGGRGGYWFALTPHILFPQRTVQHAYPLALAALLLAWEGLAGRPGTHTAVVTDAKAADAKVADKAAGKGGRGKTPSKPPQVAAAAAAASASSSSSMAAYSDAPAWYTRPAQVRLFAASGFVAGLLPLMQPHSFVAVGVVTLVTAVCQGLWLLGGALWGSVRGGSAPSSSSSSAAGGGDEESPSKAASAAAAPAPGAAAPAGWGALFDAVLQWGAFGAVAGGLALPQMAKHLWHRVSFGQGHSGFVRWNPVWAEEGKGLGPVRTWWNALGLFVPLYAVGFLLLRSREQVAVYLGFAALFVVANLVMFQPWHMDNTKVFVVWICSAGFTAQVLTRLAGATARLPGPLSSVGRLAATALFVCLTFSGALGAWREMLNNAKVYDDLDFDLAGWITAHTPPHAVFMTDPYSGNHIRPESSLAGRQVAMGFAGWLSSHGIAAYGRSGALSNIMRGGPEAVGSLRSEKITHITVDAGPARDHFDARVLDDIADPVATNGKAVVWAVLPEIVNGSSFPGCKAAPGGRRASAAECASTPGCWHMGGYCVKKPRARPVVPCVPDDGGRATADVCKKELACIWAGEGDAVPCQKPRWQLPGGAAPYSIPPLTARVAGSDCGWAHMSPTECVARGCDWRQPDDVYAPWCVYR